MANMLENHAGYVNGLIKKNAPTDDVNESTSIGDKLISKLNSYVSQVDGIIERSNVTTGNLDIRYSFLVDSFNVKTETATQEEYNAISIEFNLLNKENSRITEYVNIHVNEFNLLLESFNASVDRANQSIKKFNKAINEYNERRTDKLTNTNLNLSLENLSKK